MSQHTVKIVQEFSKPVGEIFEFLSEHNNLSKIFGVPVKRIKNGTDGLNGVGSVRRLGLPGPLGVEETVQVVKPNALIEYKITKGGGPIRNHYGTQVFAATAKGSRVEWTIRFDSLPLVGDGVATVLGKAVELGLKRLA